MTETAKITRKNQIKTLICVAIGLLIFFFMPDGNGLTRDGVKLLSIFVPMVMVWLTVGGTGWSCLLAVTLCVVLGLYDGNESYKMFWGTSMIALVIPFFMLASVLTESGALEYIVKWIISRKIVHGRPNMFLFLFTVALMFINLFCHPYIAMVLFFNILESVCKDIGETKDGTFYKSHSLLVGTVATLAETSLPWFRPWVLSMCAVIASYGFPNFNPYTMIRVSGVYMLVATVVMIVILKLWMKPDVKNFKNFDDAAVRAELEAHPMSKRAKFALGGMLAVLFISMLQTFPILGADVSAYLQSLPGAVPVSILACLYCLISVDGEPLMDIGEAAKKVPWETIMFLGAIMYFATIFGSERFGINEVLKNLLTPVVSSMPITVAFLIGLVFASLFTNLASNSVTIIVVAASFLPAMLNSGMEPAHVLAFGCMILLTGGNGICTRSANGMAALMYTDQYLKWEGTLKYTVTYCLVMVLIAVFVMIPFGRVALAGLV